MPTTRIGRAACSALALMAIGLPGAALAASGPSFEVSFPAAVRKEPLTGRVFLMISRTNAPEVVLQGSGDSVETFAVPADHLMPGQAAVIDPSTLGAPVQSFKDIPPGDYYVQAYAKAYVDYHRADGHVLWGLDQWDGQDNAESPGNLRSAMQKVRIGADGLKVKLELTQVTPPNKPPVDSEWVKNVKIKSELLSRFWGRPIYIGATVVLPKDYAAHPQMRYPVIYEPRNHYRRDGPFMFTTENKPETADERVKREGFGIETNQQFYQAWSGDHFPRMIMATLIDPTPFYDFSSAMNSVNNGPYDDAVMQELIPYLEEHFRIVREPYARILVGKSSGGRDAFGLQLHHPDFFGGAWVFYPWAFNYRKYFSFDIYKDINIFTVDWTETQGYRGKDQWQPHERIFVRSLEDRPLWTVRDWMLGEEVSGGPTGVGAELTGSDNALNSPMGPDGYPMRLYDRLTGKIDPAVAKVWRSHDLMAYVEDNWPRIGPSLVGKLHFYVGDMDEWFRNYGVRDLQAYLETAKPYYAGSFTYGPLKGHESQPTTNAELVRSVADYVAQHAPKDASTAWKDQ